MKVSKRHPAYREENLGIEFTGSHSYLNKEDDSFSVSDFLYSIYMRLPMRVIVIISLIAPFLYFGYRFCEFITSH